LDLVAPEGFFYPNFRFLGLDVFDVEPISLKEELGEVDVVLSDLAPSTTGVKNTDSARSMNLAAKAFEIAEAVLRGQGYFVCKVFEGEDMSRFRSLVSSRFGGARLLRPAATRKRSREVYLIGLGAVRSKVLPGNGECHPAGEPEQP
jgi:23S rRNA (uridine2552-2'-O)-methyltransferase